MRYLKSNSLKIVVTIISILVVAVVGSIFVGIGMDWFNGLTTPTQWIPNIVIPIVWTVIYLTIGIVSIVWITKGGLPKLVVIWLSINGLLNVIWCLVFSTLGLTFIGNVVIVLNLIAAIVLFLQIYKCKPIYAIVITIYPIWLSLATTLNLALWILN